MIRVLLFAFLVSFVLAQGSDPPDYHCKWLSTAPVCTKQECEKGWTEMLLVGTAWSNKKYVEPFGKTCQATPFPAQDQKTLCCKDESLELDPKKHCFLNEGKLCPDDKLMLAIKHYSYITSEGPSYDAFCCEADIFGTTPESEARKGMRKPSSPSSESSKMTPVWTLTLSTFLALMR